MIFHQPVIIAHNHADGATTMLYRWLADLDDRNTPHAVIWSDDGPGSPLHQLASQHPGWTFEPPVKRPVDFIHAPGPVKALRQIPDDALIVWDEMPGIVWGDVGPLMAHRRFIATVVRTDLQRYQSAIVLQLPSRAFRIPDFGGDQQDAQARSIPG